MQSCFTKKKEFSFYNSASHKILCSSKSKALCRGKNKEKDNSCICVLSNQHNIFAN